MICSLKNHFSSGETWCWLQRACWLLIVKANTSHFHFILTVRALQSGATPLTAVPDNGYKINVYSSCHILKSHHLLSAAALNYFSDLQWGVQCPYLYSKAELRPKSILSLQKQLQTHDCVCSFECKVFAQSNTQEAQTEESKCFI